MCQVILTSVHCEGPIIDFYVAGFFDGSNKAVPLPAYYIEVFH